MEKQKNFLQHTVSNKKLLPIEEEFLYEVKNKIEFKVSGKITQVFKHKETPLYDSFLIVIDNRPFLLKLNLSPDAPNSWDLLVKKNYDFHPQILHSSLQDDEFKFLFFEVPKGMFANEISNYLLSPKLKLAEIFARDLKKIHANSIAAEDQTAFIHDCFLPRDAMKIYNKYPIVDLFSTARNIFKEIYKPNLSHCAFCHFDLNPENIIYTGSEFKFVDFEYSANGNKYIDIWLTKALLNCSDFSFSKFLENFDREDLEILMRYESIANHFIFAYFNSKIIAEYMTFALRDPIKLKYWINQSFAFYLKIANELYIEKDVDKSIREFYDLWK
jgi:thiamine kinase-like enzyme